ncbi:MAG: hypothetical protein R3E95_01405 [Thiolinea sp.]
MKLLFFILLCVVMQSVAALEITDDFLQKNSVDLSKQALILHDPDNRLSPETVVERMSQPDFRSDQLLLDGQQQLALHPLINRTPTEQWGIRSG